MPEIQYKDLVWLTYRLAATFCFGIPIVLFAWASIKKDSSIIRLLSMYWKTSSLIAISILLLTSQQPIGFIVSFVSPFMVLGSVWFWIDLNEEINEMPSSRPIALFTKAWRWSLTFLAILYGWLSFLSLSCFTVANNPNCTAWIHGPQNLHGITRIVLNFLFGGNWTQALAGFIGYLSLVVYIIGLSQWLLIRLPKQGRIAGKF